MTVLINNALSLMLGWIFFRAGLHKLRYPRDYAALIDAWQLTPDGAGRWLAMPLGLFEITIATGLVSEWQAPVVAALAAALVLLYGAGIALNLLRGNDQLDCGCSGPLSHYPISGWLVLRNLVLAGLCGWWGVDAGELPLNWLAAGEAFGVAVFLGAAWSTLNDVAVGAVDPDDN